MIVYTGMPLVIAAYMDKAKMSLAISGTAANFALAAQGTVWTSNSEKLEKLQAKLAKAPWCCHPHHQRYPGWWEESRLR